MNLEELNKLGADEKCSKLHGLTGINYSHRPAVYPPINFDLYFVLWAITPSQDKKAKFLAALHTRLSVKAPKNNVGTPLVSNYDYVSASKLEQADAVLMAFAV